MVATVLRVRPGRLEDVYDLTAAAGESFVASGIVVHNCYRETLEPHGWLTQADVEMKRAAMTAQDFETEVELQEPSPEGRAVDREKVRAMFRESLGRYKGRPHEYIEVEEPEPGASYATGCDWAKTKDWTVVITLRTDVNPMRVVAFERTGRMPWPNMIDRYEFQVKRFGTGGATCFDGWGVGGVVADSLTQDAEGLTLSGKPRADFFTEYIAAIERGEIEAPFIEFMEGEHRMVTRDDLYVQSGHPPDSFYAGALAYRAAMSGFAPAVY